MVEGQYRFTNNFLLEADAAGTLNAALAVQPDEVAQGEMLASVAFLSVNVTTLWGSVRHGQVLERTLAAFVANRAIQRVRGEQELEDLLLRGFGLVGLAEHKHAFRDRCGAGGFKFRPKANLWFVAFHYGLAGGAVNDRAANLDETLAAHADRFHLWVVTEDRDVNADLFGCVHDQRTSRHGNRLSIDHQGYHFSHAGLQRGRV